MQREQERNVVCCICANQVASPLTFVVTTQHQCITSQAIDQRRERLVGNDCIPSTLNTVQPAALQLLSRWQLLKVYRAASCAWRCKSNAQCRTVRNWKHDAALWQFDALWAKRAWLTRRQDVAAGERNCNGKCGFVTDFNDEQTAVVGHCIHTLNSIATRNTQSRFNNRNTCATSLANTWLFGWVMPAIICRHIPIECFVLFVHADCSALIHNCVPATCANSHDMCSRANCGAQ